MKKIYLILVYLIFSILLSTGCQDAKEKKVKISYLYWGDLEAIQIQKKLISLFQKENPNIIVEGNPIPYPNYHAKLLNMNAGGAGPDVAYVDGYYFLDYVEKGIFLNLEEALSTQGVALDREQFYSEFLTSCIYNGSLYGLPVAGSPFVMVYNKTEFDNAAIAYPNETTDWFALQSIFQKVTKKDDKGKTTFYGVNLNIPSLNFGLPWFWANGGDFFNKDQTKCSINSKQVEEVLRMMNGYITKGWMPNFDNDEKSIMLSSEKMAIFFDWKRSYALLKSEYGFAPFPKKDQSKPAMTMTKGNAITVSSTTKHPKEALKFLTFITGETAERHFVKAGRFFPQRKNNLKFFENITPPYNPEVYAYSLKNSKSFPSIKNYEEIKTAADTEIMNYFIGAQTLPETLSKTENTVNEILSR